MDAKPLIPPISNQNQYPHFLFTSYFHRPVMQIFRGSIPTMKNLNLILICFSVSFIHSYFSAQLKSLKFAKKITDSKSKFQEILKRQVDIFSYTALVVHQNVY